MRLWVGYCVAFALLEGSALLTNFGKHYGLWITIALLGITMLVAWLIGRK